MSTRDPQPAAAAPRKERTALYTIARGLAWLILRLFFPVRYHHLEPFDMDAPYIVMSNHKSLLDPFALAYPCKKYEIRFVGKKELSKGKLASWIMEKMHMIPVNRHHTDLAAMRKCTKALKEGRVLGIFPEGTRHQPELMAEVETGVAVLALRAGVPLLPVYIDGKLKLFHTTDVYVGDPMDISDLSNQGYDAEVVHALTERIRQTFLTMREDVRQGRLK